MSASVFPAPAGMSRLSMVSLIFVSRFPRTCGDEPRRVVPTEIETMFSPHLRG